MSKHPPAFEVEYREGQWYLLTRIPIFRVPESLAMIAPSVDRLKRFSGQEKKVFGLMLQNKSNKEIADTIHISVHTVKFHVSNILRKTACDGRGELLLRELTRGSGEHD